MVVFSCEHILKDIGEIRSIRVNDAYSLQKIRPGALWNFGPNYIERRVFSLCSKVIEIELLRPPKDKLRRGNRHIFSITHILHSYVLITLTQWFTCNCFDTELKKKKKNYYISDFVTSPHPYLLQIRDYSNVRSRGEPEGACFFQI